MILEKGLPYNCWGFAFIAQAKPFKVTCFPAYISYDFPVAIIKVQLPKQNIQSSKLQELPNVILDSYY